jgi:histidinol-phosphate phosphatase family protein
MQAIILAGGKGTRLKERLGGKPKPLVDVCGVPLLERQVHALESHGVDRILVLVNHAADQIRTFFASKDFAAQVTIVDDGEPRGTAGAVVASLPLMEPRAIVAYGDTLFDIDIGHMIAAHEKAGADATLLLHPNDHPRDSHLVALDADGFVSGFHSPPHDEQANHRNLVNAAFYVVEREALVRWRDTPVPSDFGNDLFPSMIAAGQRLFGYVSAEYIKDLGTPDRLDKVERHLSAGLIERSSRRHPQRAVFMDRDGTLNRPAGHISSPTAIELIAGAGPAVRRLNDAGLTTVLVTNQPVVARGECNLETLDRIHGRMEMLLSESGAYLDRIYFCPHHPHRGYAGENPALKIVCNCRKPEIGMIEAAVEELNIDRYRSWMIGDSDADMLAANRAGLLAMRVQTGDPAAMKIHEGSADVEVADLPAAVDFILGEYPRLVSAAESIAAEVTTGTVVVLDQDVTGLEAVLQNELRARALNPVTISPELLQEDNWGDDVVLMVKTASASQPLQTKRRILRVPSMAE